MYVCLLCKFEATLDDLIVKPNPKGDGICLRCDRRTVGDAKPMPAALQHELIRCLAEVT